ncbi:MAG: GAF domain-containing protein [Flavobacteriales bacterium]|jgi:L-methionine (R)-S-oxide reductase
MAIQTNLLSTGSIHSYIRNVMAEEITIPKGISKEEIYKTLYPQIVALTEGESDAIANISNIMAALKEAFHWWWVGVYFVKENELVLGPFQGPVACTRIALGKGVCGSSWECAKTIIVDDVDAFPGHIACSSASRSEIVIPIFKNNQVVAVLDVDSEQLAHFDTIDQMHLEKICSLIGKMNGI